MSTVPESAAPQRVLVALLQSATPPRILSTLGAAFMVAALLLLSPATASAARDILIGGASKTGLYYQIATQLCRVINEHGNGQYNCVGRPGLGSVFNITAVDRGLLDIGVCQSDRCWQAANGQADWEQKGPVKKLRGLFKMHEETVLLLTRRDSGIKTVEDLRGRRVNIGNPGSGQRGNAEDVLNAYGIHPYKDIQAEGLLHDEAVKALVDKRIDALFFTVGNPSTAISAPLEDAQIQILPIDAPAIEKFVSERPYYSMSTIPAGTYRNVGAVKTYGVTATVVVSADMDKELVYELVRIVFENLDEVRSSHPAFRHLDRKNMVRRLAIPLHPGARRYYRHRGWQ
jgi:uncharacterized protein